jgi:hypothetical protein
VDTTILADIVDDDDVRVSKLSGEARLTLEAGDEDRIGGELDGEHFDGSLLVEPLVQRPIHHAHTAGSKALAKLIRSEDAPCQQNQESLRIEIESAGAHDIASAPPVGDACRRLTAPKTIVA